MGRIMAAGGELISRMVRRNLVEHVGMWGGGIEFIHRDKNGRVKDKGWVKNSLTYQGSQYVLNCAFDDAYSRVTETGWYYALYTSARDATATGATATSNELGSAGYARLAADPAPTFDQNPSYYRVSFNAETFSPGANDWASCWGIGIVDAASGSGTVFLAFAAFSTARDLAPNDTLQVQYRLTLSSP